MGHAMRSCIERVRKRIRDARGQATLEAAFALPVLMGLVLLLIQPGIILYDCIVMSAAASEGCRLLATVSADAGSSPEQYIRRRLSAIPQMEQFHKHEGGCSWQIELEGNETSEEVRVVIKNKARPLPLLDIGMTALGITGQSGDIDIEVEARGAVQPTWARESLSGSDADGWVQL